MAANQPSGVPIVQRPPTRLVASGAVVIPAGGSVSFSGSDARQDRIQIVVTNMDAALYILWGKLNGQICGAIFAQLPWTLETSADILLSNPQGSDITVYVGELYPDVGNAHGVPRVMAATAGAGATGGTGGTTGGTTSGGSTQGGIGSAGSGSGGTQIR